LANIRGRIGRGVAGRGLERAQSVGTVYPQSESDTDTNTDTNTNPDPDPDTNPNTERVAYAKPYGVPFAYGNSHANS
jgi:hypothetical protein